MTYYGKTKAKGKRYGVCPYMTSGIYLSDNGILK
jgi:hypothetical protein